ncbi:L-dopachrome tautomerase-related protein [Mucilaginibacter ginkgonis]|uniref:Gluconolactonase n=1 Tax=Mucilaginibacter ginkgonis TaxID=2682091 RepID=A0A6I4IN72_9SPHI|nr:L-dopachrome tautomerase-related protein [Mucilaginibacter ginkgonis]QQL51277.1 gluconolactonase [Mucilaginibacter ginkgonis]
MLKRHILILALTATNVIAKAQLVEVKSFGHNQPIGVAVAPDNNRLFVSFPHHQPFEFALAEIVDGKKYAYPNEEWNEYKPGEPKNHFMNVQALYADEKNCLWILDSAPKGSVQLTSESNNSVGYFKLIKIDLKSDQIIAVYTFDDLPKDKSALNDVTIDNLRGMAYLSDPGLKALVVLDLVSRKSRVVLKDDKSMLVTPGYTLRIDGVDVADSTGNAFVSNVNGIALTRDYNWLYYRAINQTKLYRLPVQLLADARYNDYELSQHIETVAETGVSHGMVADYKGNIFLSNSEQHSIQYVSPDKKVHTLVTDPQIIWPDSFAVGADGYLYFTCSQINRLPKYNFGKDKTDYPYLLFKVKLPK